MNKNIAEPDSNLSFREFNYGLHTYSHKNGPMTKSSSGKVLGQNKESMQRTPGSQGWYFTNVSNS